MSSPATISGFNVEASASSLYKIAGRKLANKFKSLRMASSPRSGRRWRSNVSYFGLPTAPKSTASAFWQSSWV